MTALNVVVGLLFISCALYSNERLTSYTVGRVHKTRLEDAQGKYWRTYIREDHAQTQDSKSFKIVYTSSQCALKHSALYSNKATVYDITWARIVQPIILERISTNKGLFYELESQYAQQDKPEKKTTSSKEKCWSCWSDLISFCYKNPGYTPLKKV